ncbi:MAG: thioether cross-link-forming SCIFF peptide maturase [Caloramator sp.]|nr:thioether cross-link-forming SCIFF peptide maturase [Caloramator sp.]
MKIHKYKQCGLNIVIDVNSGAIHVVDDVVYDILDFYEEKSKDEIINSLKERYSIDEIKEGIEEIESLINEKMLFTEDMYKNIVLNDENPSFIKAICLNIAHDCNLRCKYCFASEGNYHGKSELMSFEVGKAAIDFVIKNSGIRHNIEVDLFGGEPLLNFETVKQIIEYAKSEGEKNNKNIRFTITTNATLLNDEIIDYIDKNMGNVVLSIDGRQNVNDKIRIRRDGSGTYSDIMPKIKRMVEKRHKDKQYYVRGTFTHENLDFYEDVIFLADEGFKEISIEPVVLLDEHPLSLKEGDIPQIFEQYDKLTDEIIKRSKEGRYFKFYHFAIDVNGGPCIYKRISGCGAGHEYVAVTPNGDIYPCHQFVGNDKFKMGNVFEGVINRNISKEFKNGHIYNKPKCLDCWARFYCSGGCQANNYNFTGDIHNPYELGCMMMKKRVECAIAIKAKLSEE